MSTMTLHTPPGNFRAFKALIAAQYAGVNVEVTPDFKMGVDNKTPAFLALNPLGKVPALQIEAGMALYDSPVICEYLDSLHDGAKMFPTPGPARWQALRRQALGDGLLDAAILGRYETALRPGEMLWPEWMEAQMQKIDRSLVAMDREAGDLDGIVDIGTITFACALGYLDFRYGDMDLRVTRPALAAWYDAFAQRPAMRATEAPDGDPLKQ